MRAVRFLRLWKSFLTETVVAQFLESGEAAPNKAFENIFEGQIMHRPLRNEPNDLTDFLLSAAIGSGGTFKASFSEELTACLSWVWVLKAAENQTHNT